jgi:ribosomal protein S18 acetylase RimI-like enzyme
MPGLTQVLPNVPAPAGGVTYRLMRGLEDIPGMAAANAASRAAQGILEPVDEPEMRRHYGKHLVNSVMTRDVLVAEEAGRTVGYVRTSWRDHGDGSRAYEVTLLVDPAVWGRGVARTLLSWAGEHHRALIDAEPLVHRADRFRFLELFAFGGDQEVMKAVEDAGYRAVRRGAEMLRDRLDDELPDVPLPDGFEIRPIGPDDVRALWDAGVEAFSDSFGEGVPADEDWLKFRDDPRRDLSLVIVAYAGDDLAGYVINLLEPQDDGAVRGLLDGVATRAPYRRRGLARALVVRSLHALRERGAADAYLGVDLQNPNQALTLYESCGFRVVSSGLVYRLPLDGPWPEDPA